MNLATNINIQCKKIKEARINDKKILNRKIEIRLIAKNIVLSSKVNSIRR